MRKPIVVGNWKMNKTVQEAVNLVQELKRLIGERDDVDLAVAPPFTALLPVGREIQGTCISLSAQDVFWEKEGAFTGEVSVTMLRDVGCRYVILGHSERRLYFCETDESVNRKIRAALAGGLEPIVCVGESLEQRESGRASSVVEGQVRACLEGIPQESMPAVVLAYEPVWAIGTGKTATAQQAEEMHGRIRSVLREMFGEKTAESTRIQYGGSVKPENIAELMEQPDIDGALVGGASLEADSFSRIVKFEKK
ncbi:MAG: triose-phosphate isomerase [Deltaproteobacteria bacterium]|nr:triose-phosphate isomerase [Deltaproteobacteria bacterium]MBW2120648.1 triose-phosphate isomerase [Deltaproteobacteria bacterium]